MPLGQAPYGSRQSPPGEPPPDPDRGSRRVGYGSRIFLIGAGAMILLMWLRGSYGRGYETNPHGPAGPNPCLTDRSCAEGWRCYAVPKDDPFTVEGQCAQVCESDLQCPAHFRCERVAATKGKQVVPETARGAGAEKLGVCRACGDEGCAPPG